VFDIRHTCFFGCLALILRQAASFLSMRLNLWRS
jgi:hypothetical protein